MRKTIDLTEPNLATLTNLTHNPNLGVRLTNPLLEGSLTLLEPIRCSSLGLIDVEAIELANNIPPEEAIEMVGFQLVDVDLDQAFWWDGSAWVASDGSFSESNSVGQTYELLEELSLAMDLFFDGGPRNVAIALVIEGNTPLYTISLKALHFSYEGDEEVSEGVGICRVFGFVTDASGYAVEGVVVRASLDVSKKAIVVANGRIIAPYTSSSPTGSDGQFFIDLIPSDSFDGQYQGAKYNISFYKEGAGGFLQSNSPIGRPLSITVPVLLEADIQTLIDLT